MTYYAYLLLCTSCQNFFGWFNSGAVTEKTLSLFYYLDYERMTEDVYYLLYSTYIMQPTLYTVSWFTEGPESCCSVSKIQTHEQSPESLGSQKDQSWHMQPDIWLYAAVCQKYRHMGSLQRVLVHRMTEVGVCYLKSGSTCLGGCQHSVCTRAMLSYFVHWMNEESRRIQLCTYTKLTFDRHSMHSYLYIIRVFRDRA
jgi:hypothetical protein